MADHLKCSKVSEQERWGWLEDKKSHSTAHAVKGTEVEAQKR